MKVIPINEATLEQLREFALGTLGIDIKESLGIEQARAIIAKSWDKDGIPGIEDETESDQLGSNPVPVTDDQQPPMKKVRLTIGVTEDAGGADPIQLGVNGKIMLVPRGEVVEIPESYFEVLQHAVQFKYESKTDGGMEEKPREVPIYPYQRVA